VIGDPARRRRSDAARRSSYHDIPQTTRRPLAPGPRCPHVVPRGEAAVVSGSCSAIGNKGRSRTLIPECAGEPIAASDRGGLLFFARYYGPPAAAARQLGRSP